jgi:hypothetical protein
MKKRYSHIRLAPKADAVAKLELPLPKKPPEPERAESDRKFIQSIKSS